MNYPTFSKDHTSLMSKHLSYELFEKLKDLKTANNFGLQQVINSGVENPDSGVGVYAADEETYHVFKDLFDPIIEDCHGFSKQQKHISHLDSSALASGELDIENQYILSTRIRVARNVKSYPLGPAINDRQRELLEKLIYQSLSELTGSLAGHYYSLDSLKDSEKTQLINDHFLFKQGDRFLQSAGLNNNWPKNRGVFHNTEKTFLVWINEEDHLRIISMQKGGDIKAVFERLVTAIKVIEKKIAFMHSDHLGYISSCPTNLGTAMRASVHIKLPKLGQDMVKFRKITAKYHLDIRGTEGEHSDNKGAIYDVSNKRRLGISEVECVQDMYEGVKALIAAEKAAQ